MTPEREHEFALLMAASQRGDRPAYDALLHGLRVVATSFVRRRLGSVDWAEDVAQDVLVSIHRARHTWNPERPFAPWFYAILRNRLIDALRARQRAASVDEVLEAETPFVWLASPEAAAIAGTDLAQALRQLTPAQRVVVERLKLDELSVRQVASELRLSEANVKVIAHRGYAAIRRWLEGRGYDDRSLD
jgi:RNA polymerase sigma-70 factor (ECF subfamily)